MRKKVSGHIEQRESHESRSIVSEVVSFRPSPNLTFDTVSIERERLVNCLQDPHTAGLSFDLSQVIHCDSAGLALLIEAKRLCAFYQKVFSIHTISAVVTDLIEFCGVKTILS